MCSLLTGRKREEPIRNKNKDGYRYIFRKKRERATHTMSMALAITSRSWLSKRLTLGTSRMRR